MYREKQSLLVGRLLVGIQLESGSKGWQYLKLDIFGKEGRCASTSWDTKYLNSNYSSVKTSNFKPVAAAALDLLLDLLLFLQQRT